MSVRDPKFLKEKLRNCLIWLSKLTLPYEMSGLELPTMVANLSAAAATSAMNEVDLEFYTNELCLQNLAKNSSVNKLARNLHQYYKLPSVQRREAVDQRLADARSLISKMTAVVDHLEQNKEQLGADLFKAGAYVEIFLWPYLYEEKAIEPA